VVGRDKFRLPAGRTHHLHGFVTPVGLDVRDNDACALAREHDCRRASLSAAGTSDQGDFARQSVRHLVLPPL
jgi:hypothetical protein